jgi:predicted DNA-binding transcriptional regulator AlpA
MRFLEYADLKPKKGVPGSKVTIWRKQKAKPPKFPRQSNFGPRFHGWAEPVIDEYNKAIAAGHNEEQATIIAEQRLAELLTRSDEAAA